VLATDTSTGAPAAIKVIPARLLAQNKYVEREILNHSRLSHPHVIQFKEVFVARDAICMAMEYANGGTLFGYVQKVGRLAEPVARWFFQQLAVGLDYVHRVGVACRDVKLENTLLAYVPGLPLPLVKMCDFGYSKDEEGASAARTKVGTLTYMAPEVLAAPGAGGPAYDGRAADVWAAGVTLFAMVAGRYPYAGLSDDGAPLFFLVCSCLLVFACVLLSADAVSLCRQRGSRLAHD
jgi:serine/threonine-protein kinase SRK2